MAIKAINDLVGPNNIIFILLVFRVYPRLIKDSLLLTIITKRAKAIRKAIKEIRHFYA